MAFNPDAYLAAAPASGFNPDAYLAGPAAPAEQFSPGETFLRHAANPFGVAPALSGVLQHLVHGEEYASARDRYRGQLEQSAEQNPKAAFLGKVGALIPETAIGGGVGKLAQGAIKGTQLATKLATVAETSPVLAGAAKGALGGAAYGAAGGAGEAVSEGKDVLPAAGVGAGVGGALGGALGAVGGKVSKAFKGAKEREGEDILSGLRRGDNTNGSSTVTAAKMLDRDKEDIVRVVRENPELRKLHNKAAKDALPAFHEALEKTGSKLDPHYDAIDKATGGQSVHNLVNSLDQEVERLGKDPLNEKAIEAVQEIKRSIVKAWAPRLLETERSRQILRDTGMEIPQALVGEDVMVPTREVRKMVTRLQKRGSNVINTLNPGEASELKTELGKMMKGILDNNMDAAAENVPGLAKNVEAIRKLNSDYSAIATMAKSIEQRGWKESTGNTSGHGLFANLFAHGGTAGAVAMAAHGNLPGAAGVLAATHVLPRLPAARRAATSGLARLQEAAASGNPRAVKLLSGIRVGQQAGTAAAGAVGAASNGTVATGGQQ